MRELRIQLLETRLSAPSHYLKSQQLLIDYLNVLVVTLFGVILVIFLIASRRGNVEGSILPSGYGK